MRLMAHFSVIVLGLFTSIGSQGSQPYLSPCAAALLPEVSLSSRPLVDGDFLAELYDKSQPAHGHFQVEQGVNPLVGTLTYASPQQLLKVEDLDLEAEKLVGELISASAIPRTPSGRPVYAGISRQDFQREVLDKYQSPIAAAHHSLYGPAIFREVGVLVLTLASGERRHYFVSDGEEREIFDTSLKRTLAKAQKESTATKIRRLEFYHTHMDTPLLSYGDQLVLERVFPEWFPEVEEGHFIFAMAMLLRKAKDSGQLVREVWLTRKRYP